MIYLKEMLPYIFAILVGLFTTAESYISSELGEITTPSIATFYNLFIGVIIFSIPLMLNSSTAESSEIFKTKPILLTGGIFGSLIIYLTAKSIPSLGITVTLTLVIASQILSSFYLDTFIYKLRPLGISEIIGVLFTLVGVWFIVK